MSIALIDPLLNMWAGKGSQLHHTTPAGQTGGAAAQQHPGSEAGKRVWSYGEGCQHPACPSLCCCSGRVAQDEDKGFSNGIRNQGTPRDGVDAARCSVACVLCQSRFIHTLKTVCYICHAMTLILDQSFMQATVVHVTICSCIFEWHSSL